MSNPIFLNPISIEFSRIYSVLIQWPILPWGLLTRMVPCCLTPAAASRLSDQILLRLEGRGTSKFPEEGVKPSCVRSSLHPVTSTFLCVAPSSYLFTNSFNQYWLNVCRVPCTVWGTGIKWGTQSLLSWACLFHRDRPLKKKILPLIGSHEWDAYYKK